MVSVSPREQGSGKDRFRVGILGAGFIADYHIRALREISEAEVSAVCDSDGARAEAVQHRWGISQRFASLAEMLSAVDVVHILVPPPYHTSCAIACLEQGRSVLVEKPVALNRQECAEVERAARKTGAVVGINHNAVFQRPFLKLVQAIRDCRLGQVEHVMATVNIPLRQLVKGEHGHWMFQAPGNIVLEQAPHPLSQIYVLLGAVTAASTLCSGRRILKTGAVFYDTWQVSLTCERGTAQWFLGVGREYADIWLHVVGQDGTAFLDLRRNTIQINEKTRFVEPADHCLHALRSANSLARQGLGNFKDYVLGFLGLRPIMDPFLDGIRSSIKSFYLALASGRTPAVDMAQGMAVVAASEAILNAAGLTAPAETRGAYASR